MLPFLRKHTGLIMFVLAFVFVGLAFFGDTQSLTMPNSGAKVLQAKGRNYSEKEFYKLGRNPLAMFVEPKANAQPSLYIPGMTEFAFFLSQNQPFSEFFFANRIILRDEATKLGLVPSLEQVEAMVKSMAYFNDESGKFNSDSYRAYIRQIGASNLTENDFLDLVKDYISFSRLTAYITSSVELDSTFLSAEYNSLVSTQDVKTATLNLDQFLKTGAVDDEELKKFWEPNKTRFMSAETRSVTVYTMSPLEKIDMEKEKESSSKIPATSQKVGSAAEAMWEEIVNKKKGEDFDLTIQGRSEEHKSLYSLKKNVYENISLKELPEALTHGFNPASGQTGSLGELIFHIAPEGSKADNTSNVLIMENGDVVLFQLNSIVLSVPLEYEAAKPEATIAYHMENARRDLELAAEKLRAELTTGIAAQKSFDEIATAQKATVEHIAELKNVPETKNLFAAVNLVNPRQITQVVKSGDTRVVAQLLTRTLVDTPQVSSSRTMFKHQQNRIATTSLIRDWFANEFKTREMTFTPAIFVASGRESRSSQEE